MQKVETAKGASEWRRVMAGKAAKPLTTTAKLSKHASGGAKQGSGAPFGLDAPLDAPLRLALGSPRPGWHPCRPTAGHGSKLIKHQVLVLGTCLPNMKVLDACLLERARGSKTAAVPVTGWAG